MPRDTVKIPSMETPKKEANKTLWVTLITGVLSLATAVSVAIIQTGSASQDDVDRINRQKDASLDLLIAQINDKILPRIEKNQDAHATKIDKLLEEISDLRERLARIEERVGVQDSALVRIFKSDDKKDKLDKKPVVRKPIQKLPRLDVQQRMP